MLSLLFVALLWVVGFKNHDATKTNFFGALLGGLFAGGGAATVASAAIGAGASLIGGSKNRKAQAAANAANTPEAQVAAWERAGINPAFGISSGGYIPQQAASIGDSYSKAGAYFADAVDKLGAHKVRETELSQENTKLKKELDKLARPSEPSHLQRYGAIMPLPSEIKSNDVITTNNDQNFSSGLLDYGNNGDIPYVKGTLFGPKRADIVGSQRIEAPRPDTTMQPISVLGMTFRGTGTTSSAQVVEDNAGEAASMAWAVPALGDYVAGTYMHNIGRPFERWVGKFGRQPQRGEGGDSWSEKEYQRKKKWGDSSPRSISPTSKEVYDFKQRRRVLYGY